MFIGHVAAGLVGARQARIPLGTAILAAQLPDVIWPLLVLAGVEQVAIAPGDTAVTPLRFEHYPWSHSLVMVALTGAALGALYGWRRRSRRMGVTFALMAASHWVLDVASHRPDMPILPFGGPKLGLGLWNSVAATVVVEGALFAAAVWFYARGHRLDRGFASLIVTMIAAYVANLLGPPPRSVTVVAVAAAALVPLLWYWGNLVGGLETTDARPAA
jgi:membrane-bound metal-dependent hydrolase YbcI (DUF457 family)